MHRGDGKRNPEYDGGQSLPPYSDVYPAAAGGEFLQQFYNMVDSWVVGNFVSDGALAAVGVGFPVIFLFTSLFSGIATGGTVVIAQSFGGGRPDWVRSAIDSLYTAFIRSILPITAAALLLVHPLMTVLRVDPAAWAETRTYLLVVCAGLVGSIGYNLNAGILGAWATVPPHCCFWRCPRF